MLWYLANPSTTLIRARMASGHIGAIMSKAQGNALPPDALFCVDNNCGPGKDGLPGTSYPGDNAYLAYLARLAAEDGADPCDPDTSRCLFAVAPDVLCDAAATLRRSRYMLPVIRHQIGLPAALVAQNGLEDILAGMSTAETDGFWDDFDALFLGGDDAWKLGPAAAALTAEAHRRRKWVHMGRVNTFKRLQYAAWLGCDSADGTSLTRAPDKNLAQMLGWLDRIHGQLALFGAAAS
jgi:hypothetical protein